MEHKTEQPARRQYERAFKIDAVRLAAENGQTLNEVARQLSIRPKLLSRWRHEFTHYASQATPEQAFAGQGHDRDVEVRQLKRRIASLEMERDILPKPSASSRSPRGEAFPGDQEDAF